jgi:Superinfection immunity protein
VFQLILLNGSEDPGAAIVSLIVFLIMGLIGLAFYFLPTGIAMLRNHPNVMPIFLVNFLLGWICVGWIIALVWSVTAIDSNKHYR